MHETHELRDTTSIWTARDKKDRQILYRPIIPDDAKLLVEFHKRLSPDTIYHRYRSKLSLFIRTQPKRIAQRCRTDGDNFAFVALFRGELLGVGRSMLCLDKAHHYEFAFVVQDQDQHLYIGDELMRGLLKWVQTKCPSEPALITAEINSDNDRMKRLFKKYGFTVSRDDRDLFAKLLINT